MKCPPILVILMLLSFTFGQAGAAPPSRGSQAGQRPAGRNAMAKKRDVMKRLNLDPDQKEKLRIYRAEYRKRVASIDAKLHVKRVELENELDKPEPDQDHVKQLTQEIGQLKAERDLERLKAKKELEKILTPEQKEQLKKLEEEAHSKKSSERADPEALDE